MKKLFVFLVIVATILTFAFTSFADADGLCNSKTIPRKLFNSSLIPIVDNQIQHLCGIELASENQIRKNHLVKAEIILINSNKEEISLSHKSFQCEWDATSTNNTTVCLIPLRFSFASLSSHKFQIEAKYIRISPSFLHDDDEDHNDISYSLIHHHAETKTKRKSEIHQSSDSSSSSCRTNCTPSGFAPRSLCASSYHNNSSWLPFNYGQAAQCACTQLPSFASAPSAGCVREKLHNWTFFAETHKYFNSSYRTQLSIWKREYCTEIPLTMKQENNNHNNNSTSFAFICDSKYHEFLERTKFAERLYLMHYNAFWECCCPGHPAAQWAWELVSYFGSLLSVFCDLEIWTIESFGNCGCQGW